jgi:moderate conductance mechanosensitive channel
VATRSSPRNRPSEIISLIVPSEDPFVNVYRCSTTRRVVCLPLQESSAVLAGNVDRTMTVPAVAPLDDFSHWARGSGLEIVLLVLGSVLLVRFAGWIRDRITDHLESSPQDDASPVRSGSSKHREALANLLTWIATVLIWSMTLALVLDRLGVPYSSLVAPLVAGGAAFGWVPRGWCKTFLAAPF